MTQDLHCSSWASLVVAHGLSCLVVCGVLVPQPGIKLTSPAWEGELFTLDHQGGASALGFSYNSSCYTVVSTLEITACILTSSHSTSDV